ncbi:hypothetical protein [Pseudobacter ginsenosidimutans]|uniref:TIR domain-containing protein n=1 Tax=Pseudobacter ginsenosidimutans TaxID=661488 RepID=A0A4Q7N4L4_9BACT|nr:hypothetical protein [Pseudobacter ginsenosidimutans]QEC44484.1 hypothetical protein FSB84_23430 [Pseudobacter ginsenosidimutans]RZS75956.1 hypothetical protein EV199_1832 [Pseudobacter ginsenosidimutans]
MSKVRPTYLELPFANNFNEAAVIKAGNDLLDLFRLTGKTVVIHTSAENAIGIERNFRLSWWANKNDVLRLAMHNLGKQLDVLAGADPVSRDKLSMAWHQANSITNSSEWREAVKQKCISTSGTIYYQVFFRIAQQCINRAVRWEAVFDKITSPYFYFWQLISLGVLPLGMMDSTFYVLRDCGNDHDPGNFGSVEFDFNLHTIQPGNKKIFIAHEFNNENIKEIIGKLQFYQFDIDLGPVASTDIPIEHQLFDRIRQCSHMLVLIDQVDIDFGLPVWISQEVDLAKALGIPVLMITNDTGNLYKHPALKQLNVIQPDITHEEINKLLSV